MFWAGLADYVCSQFGWNEDRVQEVLAHYEAETQEEAVAEDEAAFEDRTQTVMEVPTELVSAVRDLIAKHQRDEHDHR